MRERLADMFARRVRFGVCFACLCCIFVTRCATTRGAGAERAETIVKKTEAIEKKAQEGIKIVNNSHATPEEKKKLNAAFNSIAKKSREIKEPVKQLGKDTDHNKKIADDRLAVIESLKKYRTIFYAALIGAAVFGFVWFKFIRKS